MIRTNKELFSCLCTDLGMRYSKQVLDLIELDSIKSELLELTEAEASGSCRREWAQKFNNLFGTRFEWPDIERPAVFRDVYQVLTFLLKIPVPVTDQMRDTYVKSFLETEAQTKAYKVDRGNPVSRIARYLVRIQSGSLDLSADNIQTLARHGPGAVYEGLAGSDKNWFQSYYEQLDRYFSYDRFFANPWEGTQSFDSALQYRTAKFISSRLTLVPKTFKGPRGVYVSPCQAVFCQIGQDAALKAWSKRCWLRLCYNPWSQSPSQEAAYVGSYGGHIATLDLSDASDRVPLSLVAYLFHRQDYLALASTRPIYVELPSGERHKMAMFAPMGDGKTFAVLSIIVSVLVVAAILVDRGWMPARPPHIEEVEKVASLVRVFGDDICVPSEYYKCVCSALQSHNLKVNVKKSFASGPFRESCGMDAYQGVDVTPVRWKAAFDGEFARFDKVVGTRNYMRRRRPDLIRTISYIDAYVMHRWPSIGRTTRCDRNSAMLQSSWDDVLNWAIPFNPDGGERPVASRGKAVKLRYSDHLQRWEVYAPSGLKERKFLPSLDPWWDLNYWLFPKGRPLQGCRSTLEEGSGTEVPDMQEEIPSMFGLPLRPQLTPWVTEVIPTSGSPGATEFLLAALRDCPVDLGLKERGWLGRAWQVIE